MLPADLLPQSSALDPQHRWCLQGVSALGQSHACCSVGRVTGFLPPPEGAALPPNVFSRPAAARRMLEACCPTQQPTWATFKGMCPSRSPGPSV